MSEGEVSVTEWSQSVSWVSLYEFFNHEFSMLVRGSISCHMVGCMLSQHCSTSARRSRFVWKIELSLLCLRRSFQPDLTWRSKVIF